MNILRPALLLSAGTLTATAQSPVADFSVQEANTGSRRWLHTAEPVSPRNYLHQVTAWYFGHEN